MSIEFGSPEANKIIAADKQRAIDELETKVVARRARQNWVKCHRCGGTGECAQCAGRAHIVCDECEGNRQCVECDGGGEVPMGLFDGVWMFGY